MIVPIWINSEEERTELLDKKRDLLRSYYDDFTTKMMRCRFHNGNIISLQTSEHFCASFMVPNHSFPSERNEIIRDFHAKAKSILNREYMNYKVRLRFKQ